MSCSHSPISPPLHTHFFEQSVFRSGPRPASSWRASALSSLTSSEVASRAVSPASRFLLKRSFETVGEASIDPDMHDENQSAKCYEL